MKMQVANSNDALLGVKDSAEIDYKKDIYRIAALWLVNSDEKILIAQRSKNKKNGPSLWGPATAGTVEEGETYESNIHKEIEEEIGLTNIRLTKGPKQRVSGPHNFFCQWFTATIDKAEDSFVLQEDEVDAVQWVSEIDLRKDVQANPDKYIVEMLEILALFVKE